MLVQTLFLLKGVTMSNKSLTNKLASWSELNKSLLELSEQDVLKLLEAEKVGKRRHTFLLRLHARYNVLRGNRERTELSAIAKV